MRVNILEFDGNTLNPKGFIDWLVTVKEVFEFKEEDDGVANEDYEKAPEFDDDQYEEELVTGDVGVNLMSTCTILGKVCNFVVDPESYDKLIAEEEVQKLGLKTKNRPKPYKLQWLKKGSEFEDELEMGDEVHKAFHDTLVRGNSKYKQDTDHVEKLHPLKYIRLN
nr:hypothetical protein [Tanacetum cinerariifolium]